MFRELSFTIPTTIKKRVVFYALVSLWVWPIFHHLMVTAYGMDPWLFFGMSMYTTPRPILEVVALEAAYPGQTFQPVNQEAAHASLPLQSNLHKLVEGHTRYGALFNPEPVVKKMFDAFPQDIDRLAFTIERLRFNPGGMLLPQDARRTECQISKGRGDVHCVVVPVTPLKSFAPSQ